MGSGSRHRSQSKHLLPNLLVPARQVFKANFSCLTAILPNTCQALHKQTELGKLMFSPEFPI